MNIVTPRCRSVSVPFERIDITVPWVGIIFVPNAGLYLGEQQIDTSNSSKHLITLLLTSAGLASGPSITRTHRKGVATPSLRFN
jgi:hypothetical protein